MMIGSGVDTIMAHSWYGMMNNMQTHLTVTQGDCTPVTMGINGEMDDGEICLLHFQTCFAFVSIFLNYFSSIH